MHRGDRSAAPLCIFGTKILLPLLTVTRERCNDYHNCKYLPGSDNSEASIYRRISLWHIPRVAAPFTLVIFRCSFVRSFVSLPPGSRDLAARERGRKRTRPYTIPRRWRREEDVFGAERRSIIEIKRLGNRGWNDIYDIRLFRDLLEELSCFLYLKLREMEESIVGIGLEDILDNWNY